LPAAGNVEFPHGRDEPKLTTNRGGVHGTGVGIGDGGGVGYSGSHAGFKEGGQLWEQRGRVQRFGIPLWWCLLTLKVRAWKTVRGMRGKWHSVVGVFTLLTILGGGSRVSKGHATADVTMSNPVHFTAILDMVCGKAGTLADEYASTNFIFNEVM
jgi:hypothetical protein